MLKYKIPQIVTLIQGDQVHRIVHRKNGSVAF